MRKSILAGLMVSMFVVCAHADDTDNIKKNLEGNLPGVKIGEIVKLSNGPFYQVVGNGINVFYTDGKGEIGFFGKMVNLKTKTDLTQAEVDKLRMVGFSTLPLDKAFVRVKGNGKRKIAIFTDPDCPYCHELEKELVNVKDVTIYTFLYPLTSIHPDSKRKAEQIWCAKDPAKTWDDWMLNQKELPSGTANCATPIADISTLAQQHWITGTPGIVFEDGELIPGMINSAEIEKHLAKSMAEQ